MIQVSSIGEATFFKDLYTANSAARDAGGYMNGRHVEFGNRYNVYHHRINGRKDGYVVHYFNVGKWLCRRIPQYYPIHRNLTGIKKDMVMNSKRMGWNTKKSFNRHLDEDHPLYDKRANKLKPYEIEMDINIPNPIINMNAVGSVNSLDRSKMPFDLLDVGMSFFAPDTSIKSLRKSLQNWRFRNKNKKPLVDIDPDDGCYKHVKFKYVISEEYNDNGNFIGSRIWCINKIFTD